MKACGCRVLGPGLQGILGLTTYKAFWGPVRFWFERLRNLASCILRQEADKTIVC